MIYKKKIGKKPKPITDCHFSWPPLGVSNIQYTVNIQYSHSTSGIMAANMEPFLKFLISIGFLPIRQGEDGVWRRDLLSFRFLAQLVIFLTADACYLYSMWDQLEMKDQTIAVFTSLSMQVKNI